MVARFFNICLSLLFATSLSVGFSLTASAGDNAQKYGLDPQCVVGELRILALIEKYERTELSGSEALISAAQNLQIADSICANGSVKEALIFYNTTYQNLTRELGDLDALATIK